MPSIQLIVSDKKSVDVLNITQGGYPHITVVHCKNPPDGQLMFVGHEALSFTHGMQVTLSNPHINSFEKDGKMRHDILTDVDDATVAVIGEIRNHYITADDGWELDKCNMRTPHITAGTYWSLDEAEARLLELKDEFPRLVTICGVCY
jgi:hypothetical protein